MKKVLKVLLGIVIAFILLISVVLVISCVEYENDKYTKITNVEQQKFDDFLSGYHEKSFDVGNDIQKKEFLQSYERRLFQYVDSARLFVNWKGEISDIKTEEENGLTLLSFDITYKPEEYREITFDCIYLVDKDSSQSDVLYRKVKDIPNYSEVYFDGFIRTYSDSTVKYSFNHMDKDLNIQFPNYEFFVVDVNSSSRRDTLSPNLQQAVDVCFRSLEPLKLNFFKKISNKEKSRRFNALLPEYKVSQQALTAEEKSYVQRLGYAITYNFLYSDKNRY